MIFDFLGLKNYIDERGIKQKAVAEKAGINVVRLCMILQIKKMGGESSGSMERECIYKRDSNNGKSE